MERKGWINLTSYKKVYQQIENYFRDDYLIFLARPMEILKPPIISRLLILDFWIHRYRDLYRIDLDRFRLSRPLGWVFDLNTIFQFTMNLLTGRNFFTRACTEGGWPFRQGRWRGRPSQRRLRLWRSTSWGRPPERRSWRTENRSILFSSGKSFCRRLLYKAILINK